MIAHAGVWFRDMQVALGQYVFSGTDVRRTLHHADDLLVAHGASADRRRRVDSAIRELDPEVAIRAVWPELLAARDDRPLPSRAVGRVERLSRSDGGVPKRATDHVTVGFRGVAGDRQATRAHHGRPWQALCLWSREVIDALVAEGHPIAPGAAGENVTIAAIAWQDVTPGVRLRIGDVLCQVSAFAVPCRQNARWFVDGRFGRIHHSNGPISRVYATVIEPGAIRSDDIVVLEP
jgi:MOSC domain-containing protein YiiM